MIRFNTLYAEIVGLQKKKQYSTFAVYKRHLKFKSTNILKEKYGKHTMQTVTVRANWLF